MFSLKNDFSSFYTFQFQLLLCTILMPRRSPILNIFRCSLHINMLNMGND